MKNIVVCENCKSENNYFRMNCSNCGSLLRDKVPNIDLFSTIWQLIETPSKALNRIIFAEHKNYLIFLIAFLVLKLVLTSFYVQSVLIEPIDYQNNFGLNFGIGFVVFLVIILLFPLLQKVLLDKKLIKTRYKDNLAILVFSQMPVVLFLVLILPIEFAVFGKFWLFSNPSPFFIKETAAYVFSIMEILIFIWSAILFGIGNYIQSKNRVYTISITAMFVVILVELFLFIPYLV